MTSHHSRKPPLAFIVIFSEMSEKLQIYFENYQKRLYKNAKTAKVLDRNLFKKAPNMGNTTYQNLLAMEMSNHVTRQLAHQNVSR